MEILEGLCFDDVLLVPQYSEVPSRSQVDLSVKLNKLEFSHPIIPANMSSVTGADLACQAIECGGLAILHRFMPMTEQLDIATDMVHEYDQGKRFGVSLGVKQDDLNNFERFYEVGVKIFCIDIAHGDSAHCVKMIREMKATHPSITLIAGNVATGSGARRLWEAGADIVKVGVGPGSLCTTRIETGNGVPQLTALMEVRKAQQAMINYDRWKDADASRPYPFISDGGIKSAGDVVKALCFADMVMIGNLFAGCVEAPGDIHRGALGATFKEYRGSSTHKTNHIEGVAAWVPCVGTYDNVLTKLLEGVRSGCSYQGALSLTEIKDNPTFIRITPAGLRESHPHDVITK
jgi:IMP dehydrogenase